LNINKLHKLAHNGNMEAQNRLFQKLSDSFYVFARQRIRNKNDIEEIVQDALMTITEKYKGIDFETSFSAWAYRVIENKLMNYHRIQTIRKQKMSQLSDNIHSSSEFKPEPVLQIKLKECLKAVSRSNHRYARVLNLSYQGYKVEEICSKLKITRNNLYNLLSRARRMMKRCLEKGKVK